MDDCKPDSVWGLQLAHWRLHDDHFSVPHGVEPRPKPGATNTRGLIERSHCLSIRAGNPTPVLSCTAWGFSCPLAYARGGGLLPRHFTISTISKLKQRLFVFCDTFRLASLTPCNPACSTRHAALWCPDFPLYSVNTVKRSSATL